MAATPPRPLSPHLTIWRWGPHMLVSILHRFTGAALTVAGLAILAWWLMALAGGEDAYGAFTSVSTHWFGLIVLIGLSWAWFQHLLSGIRHLFTDAGQAFQLDVNKASAVATLVGSALLTVGLWVYVLGVAK